MRFQISTDALLQRISLMSSGQRLSDSDADELPREIIELGTLLSKLPAGRSQTELMESFTTVVDSVRRRRRILNLVQQALSQLRLDIKYLMFDLEVTRKERDELRRQLEDEL
jgi:hypothetical protein